MPSMSVASARVLPEGSTRAIRPPDCSPSSSSFSQLWRTDDGGEGLATTKGKISEGWGQCWRGLEYGLAP